MAAASASCYRNFRLLNIMWLQWWLCLLYMLQVMVLVGMIAGYIYDVSSSKPTQSKARSPVSLFPLASDGAEREKIPRFKPFVKMKAIPLSYLKDKIPEVSSRLEFVQLFMDSEADGHLLDHWTSRNKRSNPYTSVRGLHLHQTPQQSKDTLTRESDSMFDASDVRTQKYKSFQEHVASAVKELISPLEEGVDTDGLVDADYYIDYAQDGYTEDDPTPDNLEAFEAALHHIDETNHCSAYKCKHPTPYVHRVRDPHDVTRVYLPECVVLYHCMNYTGCCGDGSECVPKSTNIVTKAFLVIDRLTELGDHVMFNPKMATTIEFVNHTECECREKPPLPRCTKDCPQPFRLTQEGVHCKCDCFPLANQEVWPCQSVRDGLVPLSPDELVCIKNGNCYTPECTVGEFDIKTGFCPLTDEYSIPESFFQNPDDRRLYREHLSNLDFMKPLTKHAHNMRDDETGSLHSEHSAFHMYPVTTREVLKSLISTTEETKIHSLSKKSEFISEAKLKHSGVNVEHIYANSRSFAKNKTKLSAESEDFNTSSSLSSFEKSIPKMNDSLDYDNSAFDKENKVNLTTDDSTSYENITNKFNQPDSLSQVLGKKNEKSAKIEEANTTPAYRTFGIQIPNNVVNSKIKRSNSEPVPDIVKKVVPTMSLLGFVSADSATYKTTFKVPGDKETLSVEHGRRSESYLLKNIIKPHLSSHRFHENFRPDAIASSSYTVSDDIKTSKHQKP